MFVIFTKKRLGKEERSVHELFTFTPGKQASDHRRDDKRIISKKLEMMKMRLKQQLSIQIQKIQSL